MEIIQRSTFENQILFDWTYRAFVKRDELAKKLKPTEVWLLLNEGRVVGSLAARLLPRRGDLPESESRFGRSADSRHSRTTGIKNTEKRARLGGFRSLVDTECTHLTELVKRGLEFLLGQGIDEVVLPESLRLHFEKALPFPNPEGFKIVWESS